MRDYSFDIMKIDWYCLLQLAWGCKALVEVTCIILKPYFAEVLPL
jgi:hypothetical protein